jgi:hypothetical protein
VVDSKDGQRNAELSMKTRFRIGMALSNHEGESADSWSDIESRYADLASANDAFRPLVDLVRALASLTS